MDQTRLAQRVLDRLTDRRVLYAPHHRENEQACLSSALDLRQDMGSIIDEAPPRSPVYSAAKEVQKASRRFMSDVEELNFDAQDIATAVATRSIFERHLDRFRGSVGHATMNLVAAYGLDVDDELATLIPFSKPE